MNRITSLIICVLTLTSCAKKHEGEQTTGFMSNFVSITDNEDAGVKEVLDFYGGRCEYSIGTASSTDDGVEKYFELEMSQSEAIEKESDGVHSPASNIAYLFFKNLKEEQSNYNAIHVVLISKDNSKQEFIYPVSVLNQVENRMPVADKTVRFLKEKKFEELKEMLNNEFFSFDKDELISRLEEVDPQFGNIVEFRPFGFEIVPQKDKEILHISGIMFRDKQNHEFSIDIDLNSVKMELYLLQYKY